MPELEDIFRGADLVFVTAGMGGGTGTGSAPVVARVAKEMGAIVVAMVTTPFHIEQARVLVAEEGLASLRTYADTSIVMDNNRLLECAPHLPLDQAFFVVDQIIAEIILGITETTNKALAHQSRLCRRSNDNEHWRSLLHVRRRGKHEKHPGEDCALCLEKSAAGC